VKDIGSSATAGLYNRDYGRSLSEAIETCVSEKLQWKKYTTTRTGTEQVRAAGDESLCLAYSLFGVPFALVFGIK
jgi:hypothetical protein